MMGDLGGGIRDGGSDTTDVIQLLTALKVRRKWHVCRSLLLTSVARGNSTQNGEIKELKVISDQSTYWHRALMSVTQSHRSVVVEKPLTCKLLGAGPLECVLPAIAAAGGGEMHCGIPASHF